MRTKGAAGSSKFDTDNWRIILGSNVFGNHSLELQTLLARMTEKLCSHVPMSCYKNLEALLASQLIPLNKSPDVTPIGVGEVLRKIIGKAVMSAVKKERGCTSSRLISSLCRPCCWRGISYSIAITLL